VGVRLITKTKYEEILMKGDQENISISKSSLHSTIARESITPLKLQKSEERFQFFQGKTKNL